MVSEATHEVVIDDLTHDGQGVTSVDGERVFVADVLPQETVVISLGKRRRKLRQGQLHTVVHPSHQRVEPACEYFGRCGGCGLQHLAPAAQLEWKTKAVLETLRRIGGADIEAADDPITSVPWNYRRRARVGIKYVARKGRVLAGFRERAAPYVTDMEHCRVLTTPFDQCLGRLASTVADCSISQQIPQAELAAGDDHGAVVLRVLQPPSAEDEAKLAAFGRDFDLDIYLQPGGLNSVAPLDDVRQLSYRLPTQDLTLSFLPTDFIQINGSVNRAMVDKALQLLAPEHGDRVLDLFCGLGNFTLPLARHAHSVLGLEGSAALVARASVNAQANAVGNVDFSAVDLAQPAALPGERYDLVLLDPPRTGAAAMIDNIVKTGARKILYVSCHPGTLARDTAALQEQGYSLRTVVPVDMFPHTHHIETMALFEA